MVDVGKKQVTKRKAGATGMVFMAPATVDAIRKNSLKKGEALATARVAGIMAAKNVASLIPLTHSLSLDEVQVDFEFTEQGVKILSEVSLHARTGAEMEALTAVCVAALTIYDMAKAVDKNMTIGEVRLEHKSGGRSGKWKRNEESS